MAPVEPIDACRCIYSAHCHGGPNCRLRAGGTVNDGGGICSPSPDSDRLYDRLRDLVEANVLYVANFDETGKPTRVVEVDPAMFRRLAGEGL